MPVELISECISGGGGSQRSLPPPFLTKIYQLVSDASVDDYISWNEDGTTFIVWRPAEFARDILPKHFKHNNFASFIRQLNTYGFKKIMPDRWEFANEWFKRGEKDLLRDIQRRKISPTPSPVSAIPVKKAVSLTNSSGDEQVISSNSSQGATTTATATLPAVIYATGTGSLSTKELIEDNERLRKENARLREELKRLKTLCGGIYRLMSDYYGHQAEEPSGGVVAEGKHPVREGVNGGGSSGRSLEDEPDSSPRLFGVCLKRRRLSDESANSD